jgi:hypothetical protein
MLQGAVKEHVISDYIACGDFPHSMVSSVVDAENARQFEHEGASLGWGALSSAIDLLRDPEGRDDRFAELLPRLTYAAVLSYEGTLRFLQHHGKFDAVYVFNGRFEATLGASLAVVRDGRSQLLLHERGANIRKYAVFDDGRLHSRHAQPVRILRHWDAADSKEMALKEAEAFYANRRRGHSEDWWSFVSLQASDRLPNGWDASCKNIVIFNSSEDERAAAGDEWKNGIYGTQSVGISQIVNDLQRLQPCSRVYLRMHPNLKGVENADIRRLLSISSPNFFLIGAESDISSYALMQSADAVLTFGSTMGIEAAFWGKCSILAGPADYEKLGSVHVMESHEQVLSTLMTIPAPKERLGAIQYGYYRRTFGEEFRYWNASGFIDGTFLGHSLHPKGKALAGIVNRLCCFFSSQARIVRLVCLAGDLPGRLLGGVRRWVGSGVKGGRGNG